MDIKFYPDNDNLKSGSGSLVKEIEKLAKKQPELYSLLVATLNKVKSADNLDFLKNSGWVKILSNCARPIYEFRIPPVRRGGVIRLYFSYKKNDSNTIIILTMELKKSTNANATKIKDAEKRYKEVCI